MKAVIVFSIVTISLISFSFKSYSDKINNITIECDSVPEMNKHIIDFVKTKIKKKVGRGECWDIAYEALTLVHAKWDGKYKYGKEVKVENDCIYPGDMIQFEGVVIKYKKEGIEYKEAMSHHTAIIYEVKEKGEFILAHQNTEFTGKKVGLSPLNIADITKGKYKIYQPEK
jgi:hypothetical protein